MKYTLLWRKSAEDTLITLWMNATDRNAITDAANEIERRLAIDPQREGESRDRGTRILIVGPLAVRFNVVPSDRTVWILELWLTRRP